MVDVDFDHALEITGTVAEGVPSSCVVIGDVSGEIVG